MGRKPKAKSGQIGKPRSIRFAKEEWKRLQQMAKDEGLDGVADLLRLKFNLGGSGK